VSTATLPHRHPAAGASQAEAVAAIEAVERELRTVEAALARARAALAESGEAVAGDAGAERPARRQPQAPDARRLRPPQPLTGEVERARLLYALRADPPNRLVVVWGVAGSGKTTLLAQWAARQTTRLTAWLALEPGERDPGRFVAAVLAAVRAAGGESHGDARARHQREDLPALLDRLAGSRPVLLVLDDFQEVDVEPVGQALARLLERLPPGWQVAIASRHEPAALPLARMRLRREVREIRPAGLAMDSGEARELLERGFGVRLDRLQLAELLEATDGWVGGLSLAGAARSGGAAGEEAEGWLLDYAERDMLSGVPDELVAFLTDARVLSPLSSAPCAAVSGRPDAPALLREARRRDLVVADERGGCRPRRPVSGVLARRVGGRPSDDELHLRAAAWFAETDAPRAAHHLLCAGREAEAADLIGSRVGALWDAGRWSEVADLLRRLSAETLDRRPELRVALARASVQAGQPADAALEWLAAAEGAGSGDPEAGALRATLSLRAGRVGDAAAGPGFEAAYFAGEVERARALCGEALESGGEGGSPRRVAALGILALIDADDARPQAACEHARAALARSERCFEAEPLQTLWALVALSRCALPDDARAAAERAERLAATAAQSPFLRLCAALARVSADIAAGRLREARHALAVARNEEGACPDAGLAATWLADAESAVAVADRALAAEAEEPVDRNLTDRELQILRALSGSLSQRDIGRELHLSFNTVRTYVRGIYRKLGVGSREEAVERACALGLAPAAR
jgi:ATP/maltotriose-dependent transcriptional regulator MalT